MLSLATKRARQSVFKQQVGAVLVKGGRVISTGYNQLRYTSSKTPRRHEQSLHAEQACILRAPHNTDFKGSILFISRVTKDGKHALAKPCPFCTALLKSLSIKKVVYTTGPTSFTMENL